MAPSTIEARPTISSVWPATWPTMRWLRAPTYWAIRVEPAIDRPPPIAKVRNIAGKLTDTAASAATIGTASVSSERRIGPSSSWFFGSLFLGDVTPTIWDGRTLHATLDHAGRVCARRATDGAGRRGIRLGWTAGGRFAEPVGRSLCRAGIGSRRHEKNRPRDRRH